ncbi:MAG: TorF family putative porin [Rhodospirillales bacterium]
MPRALILAAPSLCLVLSAPAFAAAPDATAAVAVEAPAATADGVAADETGDTEASEIEVAATETPNGDDADAADDEATAEDAPDATATGEEESWLPGEISADVALVSDYIFRGITNTDHNPAIQGGLSYSVDVGLPYAVPYAAFWGSNVDFDDGGEATVELDMGFGLSGTLAGVEWDLGGLYYAYPGANSHLDYNYWEIPLKLSYPIGDQFSLISQYAFSPNYFADSGQAHYLLAGGRWEQPIGPTTLAFEATTGHQWIADNGAYGVDDYQDWRIGLSLTIEKITLGVAYTDTTLSKSQCFGGTNQCEPRAVFSLGASF